MAQNRCRSDQSRPPKTFYPSEATRHQHFSHQSADYTQNGNSGVYAAGGAFSPGV